VSATRLFYALTHFELRILTVQAWDNVETEYRIQENININVHE